MERPRVRRSGEMQPKWKFALIVWIAIWPTITVFQAVLGPLLRQLPLPLATFVTTAVVVPLMVYVLIPALMKTLGPIMGMKVSAP